MQDFEKKQLLQKAKNIAILGLSPDESKASNVVARYLIAQGFNVIPIYPRANGEILGRKAYASLQEAFNDGVLSECGEIDILNVFRKSEALQAVANEVLRLKNQPKCVWVQLGLFNENSCIKLEFERLFSKVN